MKQEGTSWEDQSCTSPAACDPSPDYDNLIDYGLNEKVAHKLDQIYQQGKLKHEEWNDKEYDDGFKERLREKGLREIIKSGTK